MKTCIVFNPAARGDKATRFRDHLGELSAQAVLKPTYAPGSGRALAAEAVREGFETIVAAGGDGTLNEVLNGLGDVPDAFDRVRLGLLPLGTVNVFAKELRLPLHFEGAWRVVTSGQEQRIDLPYAEFARDGAPVRRYFAQLAGAGLDARAVELVDLKLKRQFGPLAYVAAGFKALQESKPAIIASGPRAGGMGELVIIGNGRYYGGRFALCPQADLRDGVLDVTVFPKTDWMTLLRFGWGWATNKLLSATGAINFQTPAVTLTCSQARSFELDGEFVGHLPVTFSLEPQRLRVLVP